MRHLALLSFTGLLALALAASSGVPIGWHSPATAELRLSWSARPERIERCRRLADAELAERPVHMRQRIECEGRAATYLLTVHVDDVLVDSAVVTGAGLRHDRPIFLLRGYDVAPGERRVRIVFRRREEAPVPDSARLAGTPADDREAREAAQRRGLLLSALPSLLELAHPVDFRSGEAVLVTVDGGRLALRTP